MQRRSRFIVRAAIVILFLVALPPRHAASADAPAKLKTQTVLIKIDPALVSWPEHPEVPLELVQLPPGKITLRGADG
jgi:hypothetical protein